jgi:GT2 family glycosyltransferase
MRPKYFESKSSSNPDQAKIAVIMSCHGHLSFTKQAIESYYRSLDDQYSYHFVLFDDRSRDNTYQYFLDNLDQYQNFHFFHYRINMGLTQTWNNGVNFAIKKLKADYIFLVNSDIIFSKNCLSKLSAHLKNNPDLGMVGPMTNSPGGQPFQDILRILPQYQASVAQESINEISHKIQNNKMVATQDVNGFFMGFSQQCLRGNIYSKIFNYVFYFDPFKRNLDNEGEFERRLKRKNICKMAIAENVFIFHFKDVSVKHGRFKRFRHFAI